MARDAALLEGWYANALDELLPGAVYDGVVDTPGRAARALLEMTSGYDVDVAALFRTFEDDGYDEMIAEAPIPFTSLCEHHMLPFAGNAGIVYIPNGRIVGLSKLARLVDAYARRLQVQERMTLQIADAIEGHMDAKGVMVLVQAEHSCIGCRGVRKSGVTAVTNVVRGAILEKPEARAEALDLLRFAWPRG